MVVLLSLSLLVSSSVWQSGVFAAARGSHSGSTGMIPMVLDAAKHAALGDVPTDDEMEHDLRLFEIAPLFDGADLERI